MQKTCDLLTHLRGVCGLSQVQISRLTGIPQHKLSRWYAGHIPAGADEALKLKDVVDSITAKSRRGQ